MPASDQSFIRSALSNPEGGGSAARVCMLLLVVFPLLWVTYLVLRDHRIPDLTGVTTFIAATTGTVYGTNKVTRAIAARKCAEPTTCP